MQRIPVAATVAVLLACVAAGAAKANGPRSSTLDVSAFGRLPIVMSGSVRPIDTVAQPAYPHREQPQAAMTSSREAQPDFRFMSSSVARRVNCRR